MTKRLIEIEDDLLEQAQDALGTETIKDTVSEALEHVVRSQRRTGLTEEDLVRFAEATADLRDTEVMAQAWR